MLALALVVALPTPAAAAPPPEEPLRLGPLPHRTRNPLYILHLQPGPRRARTLDLGVFEFQVQVDASNVWEKWSRVVAEGVQLEDIDMELIRTAFTARVGLPLGFEFAVEVPFVTLVGGITDGPIQAWHRLLNAENGGRDWVRNDRFNYEIQLPHKLSYSVDRPVTWGFGDITTELSVQFLKPRGPVPGLSGRFMLKLPTGRVERGTGSGDPDLAAVLHFEHGFRRFAVYGSAGVIILGREGVLGEVLRPASFTWTSAVEVGLTPGWSLIAQLHGNTAFHQGFVHRFISWSPVAAGFGTKVRLGAMDIALGMEQDILNGDPAADVTVFIDASWRVGGAPAVRPQPEP